MTSSHADMGNTDMLTRCHAEILMLGHAVSLTCSQAPEWVACFLLVVAMSCLHIFGHMRYANIIFPIV